MSDEPASPSASHTGLSKQRLEALTDGIFAVAMTLLVIELKLPERADVSEPSDLARALVQLVPTFIAWIGAEAHWKSRGIVSFQSFSRSTTPSFDSRRNPS
jgi:Endosomal/lysosomal potassium channel TMEM175